MVLLTERVVGGEVDGEGETERWEWLLCLRDSWEEMCWREELVSGSWRLGDGTLRMFAPRCKPDSDGDDESLRSNGVGMNMGDVDKIDISDGGEGLEAVGMPSAEVRS